MSDFKPNDPLLLGGKIITLILQGLMALATIALAVAIPVVILFQDKITAEIIQEKGIADFVFPGLALGGFFALLVALFVLGFLFFGRLRRIIATVGEGDPFDPVNADRLAAMGWLALAAQLMLIPLAALGYHLAQALEPLEETNIAMDAGIDPIGILLVLVLFILARVFRHGAAMRDDLEGTV